jgi:putative peptide zinc metalloprotease protein
MKMGIWATAQTRNETGGIWHRVASDTSEPDIRQDFNLWLNLSERPGGMWGNLEKETLLISERRQADIWDELNDETLIIRPHHNLWQEIHNIRLSQRTDQGIWAQVGDETQVLVSAQAEGGLWRATTGAGDYTQRKPTRRLGWALKELHTVDGQEYFVLKNTRAGAYLRLSEEQVYLWNLMDGQHSIRDMAVAYYLRYKSLAVEGLLSLLRELDVKGFLVESQSDLFSNTAQALGQNRIQRLRNWLVGTFLQTTFTLRGIDNAVTKLYKGGIFLVFTKPIQMLILMITLTGLTAFGYHAWGNSFSILRGGSEGLVLGLVGFYIAMFIAILLHESAHAFSCKHYGRDVHQAGFMIYLGMPAFFVDTSDIWMEPRRPRMLVSWAGPYSGFFLGALSSLLIFAIPSPVISGWLFQFAFTCILLSFANLNPLLLWDGYYLLMDWLEMPMLRQRALAFVRGGLWKKISACESFGRDDKIYTVYGLFSFVWTILAVGASLWALIRAYIL